MISPWSEITPQASQNAALLRRLPDAPSLGQQGFELPDLVTMDVLDVTDDTDLATLTRHGIDLRIDRSTLHPGRTRVKIYYDSNIKKRNLVVLVSNRTIDATMVLGNQHGINGRVQLNGSNCWYIDTGSVHRPSHGSIHLLCNDSVFYFGAGATANQFSTTCKGAGKHVLIGADCMLATEILLYATDFHGVFDIGTKVVLNEDPAVVKSIVLEPHVWLASRVMVGKGVRIGKGSLIGAASVVTRDIPEYVAAAGNPAKVIKEQVSWTRDLQPSSQAMDDVLKSLGSD